VEAFACLYERQKPCKMGFSPCKTCSFRKWENDAEREREREREKTEDTLLLLSATISLFLPYTQTGQEANYSAYCLCSTTRQQQIQT